MRFSVTRVGAFAPALLVFVSALAASETGASAQIQDETAPAVSIQDLEQPEIRFIPGEVLQDLSATPEADDTHLMVGSLRELVAATNTSDEPAGELRCLAQAIYFEARGESLDGQLAVAQVIINRAENDRFPDGYCGVVRQPSQFSFVRGGRIPSPNSGSAAWVRAKAIAKIADDGLWQSEADDALYFHARRVNPSWARTKVARATIESHVFYR